MSVPLQIVFDCADPDKLARFYAAALGFKLQDPPEGFATWEAFLESRGVPKEEWNSASAIVDPDGRGPRIYFQQMLTPKPGKNRVHLDINVGGGRKVPRDERVRRIGDNVARLLGIGATKQRIEDSGDEYWVVMQDPEGNEFCLQ